MRDVTHSPRQLAPRIGTPAHEPGARCKLFAQPCAAKPAEQRASTTSERPLHGEWGVKCVSQTHAASDRPPAHPTTPDPHPLQHCTRPFPVRVQTHHLEMGLPARRRQATSRLRTPTTPGCRPRPWNPKHRTPGPYYGAPPFRRSSPCKGVVPRPGVRGAS